VRIASTQAIAESTLPTKIKDPKILVNTFTDVVNEHHSTFLQHAFGHSRTEVV